MKINTVDTVIQDFRDGLNIFRRPSVELMVREISRLQARVQELEQERQWIHQDKTMIAKKDGDSWCFVLPDFINLQESKAEFVDGILYRFIEDIYKRLLPPQESE